MTKFWRVVWYEYRKYVLRRRFLLTILGLPFFVVLMLIIGVLIGASSLDNSPLGYVDQSDMLAGTSSPNTNSRFDQIELIAYPTEREALSALNAEEIQAYYVLPAGYPEAKEIELFYLDERPRQSVQQQFRNLVRTSLLKDQPSQIAQRLLEGPEFVTPLSDGTSQSVQSSILIKIVLPTIASIAFVITIFTSSGYLMQAVVEEKENRTMEVLITSLSPGQLMAGKIVGISGVGLTQIFTWLVSAAVVLLIGRFYFDWIGTIRFETDMLLSLAVTMLPAFVMVAALMTTVGSTVTQASEGQQMTGLFTLPVMAPYWFTGIIISNPDSPLVLGLSFFPFTAPVTMALRSGATVIPAWQIAIVALVLLGAAAVSIWLAGRAFRLGMLRYGQRLSWRELVGQTG